MMKRKPHWNTNITNNKCPKIYIREVLPNIPTAWQSSYDTE